MSDFLLVIGQRIREIRKKNNLTINELGARASVSNGLISRIENGRTIPSLPVLLEIIQSLEVDASYFFEAVEKKSNSKYIVVTKKNLQPLEKETEAKGFKYLYIFSKSIHSLGFEAVLLTVEPKSEREKVVTDAWEFKYILKGKITYLIDNETVNLEEGDSIYFNGKFPHVPVNKSDNECIMLVMYFYNDRN